MTFIVQDSTEINDTTSENGIFKITPKPVLENAEPLIEFDHKDHQHSDNSYDFKLVLNHREMKAIIAAFEKFMTLQEQEQAALIQEAEKKAASDALVDENNRY